METNKTICPICGTENDIENTFSRSKNPENENQEKVSSYLNDTNTELCCRMCFIKTAKAHDYIKIASPDHIRHY